MIRRNRLVPRPRVTTLRKIRINKLFERLSGPFCTHSYPGIYKLLLESVHRWRLVNSGNVIPCIFSSLADMASEFGFFDDVAADGASDLAFFMWHWFGDVAADVRQLD
ncbi:hypothetical protein Hdeb2414_s0356g00875611 [Helianthus debilis subsp. tardiflorus]